MTNFLNLDELAPAERTFTLKGVKREIRPMTVSDFIRRQREAKGVTETDDPAEQVERAVKMLTESITNIGAEDLKSLTMEQLTVLINFVVNPPEAKSEAAEAAGEAGETGK